MPAVPRITRAVPTGDIVHPPEGIPVIARLRWPHGWDDIPAIAIAWAIGAVEIRWELDRNAPLRSDWIPAGDVRRVWDAPADEDWTPSTRDDVRIHRWSR